MEDDTSSQLSWSGASEADRLIFSVLSNTERLDIERLPPLGPRSADTPRIEELPSIPETAEEPVVSSNPRPTTTIHDNREPTSHVSPGGEFEAMIRQMNMDHVVESNADNNAEGMRHSAEYAEEAARRAREEYAEEAARRAREEENAAEEAVRRARKEEEAAAQIPATTDRDEAPPPQNADRARENVMEKQSTLLDLQGLEQRGVKLSRRWTMEDSLDDMTLELRHHILMLDERENVGMMKTGMRMALTGIEMLSTRFNLLDLEGWSAQACSEMDRQDNNLARIYRKYWRRSTSNNPESEILMALVGSAGMYHMKRSMARQMLNSASRRRRAPSHRRAPSPESSDDEVPPAR